MQSIPQKPSFLAEFNNFIRLPSGVYASGAHPDGLSYSDGDYEEEYIYKAVSSAKDISSLSEELHHYERDWASECHLSSKRANVFRSLDFTGKHRILEVGSGCGAITRFLGEQGKEVDAVEGSLRRAEITRLRCRDLANVSVIHADFNRVRLPADYYDLAFLTGVLEYAGKYGTKGNSPFEAAVTMLQQILDSLGPKGKLIVAIENRIGFKYLAGASEDHFSRPWVGICNYPDCKDPSHAAKQGIKTWDRASWERMLERLTEVSCQWYYPFPDYKLATTLLSESFIKNTTYVSSCLTRVQSRDYTAVWRPFIEEQFFWQLADSAAIVEEMANSFVLVLEKSQDEASDFVPFDFVHFSGQTRKPGFRTMVLKNKGSSFVERRPLFDFSVPAENDFLTQHLEPEPFYDGELLITYWLRTLKICSSPATLDELLKNYYSYLLEVCEITPPEKVLDLLPMNIVILEDGNWVHFDQEWHAQNSIAAPFILFRTILYFFWNHKDVLSQFCKEQKIKTGWHFVEYCLGRILYTHEIDIPNFVKLEDKIQQTVCLKDKFVSVEKLLDSLVESVLQSWSWENTSLVWGEAGAKNSTPESVKDSEVGMTIHFPLPVEICSSPFLQFHLALPESKVGTTFALHGFSFFGVRQDGEKTCLFPVDSTTSSPPMMQLTGLSFFENVYGGIYAVTAKEPQIFHFEFPSDIDCSNYVALECQATIEFLALSLDEVKKEHYKLEKQNLDVALAKSSSLVTKKTEEVIFRDKLIAEKNDEIHALFALAEGRKHRLQEIEESRAWKAVVQVSNFLTKITGRKSLVEKDDAESYQDELNNDSRHSLQEKDELLSSVEGRQPREHFEHLVDTDKVKERKTISTQDRAKQFFEKQEPLISVIVATFNTLPEYLQETLDAVLAQSYNNWEVIIVDNGSQNGCTLDFLRTIDHPKIKVHCHNGMGNLTQAMDAAVLLASGDWIIFAGHYDKLRPESLAVLSQYIHKKDADLLFWDETVIDRAGAVIDTITKQQLDALVVSHLDFVGSSLCVRKDLLVQAGGLNSAFDGLQFLEFVVRVHARNVNIVYVDKFLSETRQFDLPSESNKQRLQELKSQIWQTHASK